MGGSVALSAPDLAASTRWKDSHGNQPEALTTLADNGSSPLGVGTGQPGSGVTESSASAWSDSQIFLTGDGTGVTAKTPWERGCHLGNSLPSS